MTLVDPTRSPEDRTKHAISSVHVRGLHGKSDYDIQLVGSETNPGIASQSLYAVRDDRLTLLYGSNGTGKTSLLRLLFHALSPHGGRGHRKALIGIKFSCFTVRFANGDTVVYERPEGEFQGPLAIRTTVDGEDSAWVYTGEPAESELHPERRSSVLASLGALSINPTFLSDSRAFHSDLIDRTDRDEYAGIRRIRVEDIVSQRRDADLNSALERLYEYLAQLVFLGAQRGSQRVDGVYLDVTSAVAHAGRAGRPRKATIPNLRTRINDIGERAEGFTKYGLIPEFPRRALLGALADAQDKNGPLLEHVLTPYLNGLTERMNELDSGLAAISTFVTTVNGFLQQKSVAFRISSGTHIIDDATGDPLVPVELSSGEKQILLLLANLVAMRESTALFIIDEPELSLNPEWQRSLIPALLAVTDGSGMQLVAATHSIEIMALYRERMRRLG